MDQTHALLLMRYNAWANARLYDAVGRLAEEEIVRLRPSFFGSILKTLNHLIVGDRLWMGRLTGVDSGHRRLDEVPYAAFPSLRAAREEQDKAMVGWVEQADPAFIAQASLEYATTGGESMVTPVAVVIAHMVNHGTHHRGQVHGLLSQTEVAPPPLDLIYYTREI
ncbi:MAG: DinB family protein [Rhodospirillum sp.]|nr:DinB family protein [Rhodospirillum sp.]MCF8487942.1 DinB family protein [Rhodospirillum sp.]MCF8499289.1 DinB family protein [Rhodospirillum sp.]